MAAQVVGAVDVDEPELWAVAVGPLPVVGDGPVPVEGAEAEAGRAVKTLLQGAHSCGPSASAGKGAYRERRVHTARRPRSACARGAARAAHLGPVCR